MATLTKTQIIAKFNQMYPDCDATTAGNLFDQVHGELLDELKIRKSTLVINLTAGTREYALSSTVVHIEEAYYQSSADSTSWVKLVPVSTEQLSDWGNWREQSQQCIPGQFYITTAISGNTSVNQIGFVQIPPITTSASYPNVTLFGDFSADLVGADLIPVAIVYPDAYCYRMCEKFSIINNPDKTAYWVGLAKTELQRNKVSIREKQQGNEGFFFRPSFINYTTRGR